MSVQSRVLTFIRQNKYYNYSTQVYVLLWRSH